MSHGSVFTQKGNEEMPEVEKTVELQEEKQALSLTILKNQDGKLARDTQLVPGKPRASTLFHCHLLLRIICSSEITRITFRVFGLR